MTEKQEVKQEVEYLYADVQFEDGRKTEVVLPLILTVEDALKCLLTKANVEGYGLAVEGTELKSDDVLKDIECLFDACVLTVCKTQK